MDYFDEHPDRESTILIHENNDDVAEMVYLEPESKKSTCTFNMKMSPAEVESSDITETEPETQKTVSCFSAMTARFLRTMRKRMRRARRSER